MMVRELVAAINNGVLRYATPNDEVDKSWGLHLPESSAGPAPASSHMKIGVIDIPK